MFLGHGGYHPASRDVISKLKQTMAGHGCPVKIITDGGPQYTYIDTEIVNKRSYKIKTDTGSILRRNRINLLKIPDQANNTGDSRYTK